MAKGLVPLFSTFVAQGVLSQFSALNRVLLQEIDEISSQDKMGKSWSRDNYLGGYTSYGSLSDMHHRTPGFQRFAELLQPHALNFAKTQEWEMRGLELKMTACWMNIMSRHTYHSLHNHPHSVISGAYYVSIPKGSVSLKLEDPRMNLFMNAPSKKRPSLYHEVKPKPGTFVLFDSWLRHEVPPNQSSEPRVSISFNYSLETPDDL